MIKFWEICWFDINSNEFLRQMHIKISTELIFIEKILKLRNFWIFVNITQQLLVFSTGKIFSLKLNIHSRDKYVIMQSK
jgi:hypothetical protein